MLWLLAQTAVPPPSGDAWMWIAGVAVSAVGVLFGLYVKEITGQRTDYKTSAKELTGELVKSTDTIRSLKDIIDRSYSLQNETGQTLRTMAGRLDRSDERLANIERVVDTVLSGEPPPRRRSS